MKVVLLVIILCFSSLFSQQKETKEEQKPVDLPEAIIYGNDFLNVKSGFKRNPSNVPKLSASELDSLNSLEKIRPSVLPVSKLPFQSVTPIDEKGYVQASLGRFITTDINAGYVTEYNDFDLYLKGSYDQSRGFIDNAEYSKINAQLFSDYIADEKFFIFGGSKTRTNLKFQNFRYNNYVVQDFETRNNLDLGMGLDVDGHYEGFNFETGAAFNVMKTNGDSLDFSEQTLNGYFQLINPYNKYRIGFNIEADLRSSFGNSNNYMLAEGIASYISDGFDLKLRGGFQLANYFNGSRSAIKLDAKVNAKLSSLLTMRGAFSSGLERQTVEKLFAMNRFLNYDFDIDHQYNKINVVANVLIHPDIDYNFSFGVNYKLADRVMNFVNLDSSYFSPSYINASIFNIYVDGFYNFNDIHSVDLAFKYNATSTDSINKKLTYIPDFENEVNYRIKLDNGLSAKIGFEYVGTRYVDLLNSEELDPYFNMNFDVNYLINKNLSIFAKVDNLFNQDIFIYNYYRERTLFASMGFHWKF
jgi:hypothetical protein